MTPVKRLVFAIVLACAALPAAAQTYRWTDERGVTTYGPKPPPGRGAQPVDTQPRGPADLTEAQRKDAEAQARQRARIQALTPPPLPPPRPAATPGPRGMPFDTYIRLERGMTEGELVQRAGAPDQLTIQPQEALLTKSYYYFPTTVDPWTTVVTVSGGRIAHIERTRKF